MRPLDLAAAYATFAAEGTQHNAHFITHVTNAGGNLVYRAADHGKPAFDQDPARSKDIANQVTGALRDAGACGPQADAACLNGEWRPGGPDREQVSHAWTVGYTPRMSVAVFVGSDQPAVPAVDKEGRAIVGSGLPNEMWRAMQEKLTP
jgi:membrane peptidoglycan carboxypeptidase